MPRLSSPRAGRPRPGVLALTGRAAAAVVVVGGTVGFLSLDESVVLVVDGVARTVDGGGTVAEVLAREGLELGEHDLVAPAAGSDVRDGDRIVVRQARPLALVVDGERRDLWVTADTVDDALAQLGLRSEAAYVSASRSRRLEDGGTDLEVRTPKEVVLVADGTSTPLTTTAATVADVLAEAGVELGERDLVSVPVDAAPATGMVLTVTRVEARDVVEVEEVPFETVERETEDLLVGESEVLEPGAPGERTRVYRDRIVDGERDGRELVSDEVTREPQDRVVLVGTGVAPEDPEPSPTATTPAPAPEDDGLDWAALAECESGGDPTAVNPAGPYYGLYQFSEGTWRSVGGEGLPSEASPEEQTARAQALYDREGAAPWPHCGKHL